MISKDAGEHMPKINEEHSINPELKEVLAKIFQVDKSQINESLKMDDLEQWDSMCHLVLIGELETRYGVQFPLEEVTEMTSYKAIVDTLRKHEVAL